MHFTESVENADAWEQERLGDVLDFLKDGTHGTHKDSPNGPYLLSAKNIKYGVIEIDSEKDRKISWNDYNAISKSFQLKSDDVLLTIVGSIGEVAILKNPENITFQRSVAVLRPSQKLLPTFLSSTIQTKQFQDQLNEHKNSSAQAGVYLGALEGLTISIPSLKEQADLGSFFSCIDNLLSLHQRVHFGITINHLKNPNAWEQHELWKLTIWDKKFNEVDKEKQPETRKYRYALADAINLIIIPGGDIKILSTGSLDAYTTKERAGEYLCNGEIVAIPWGGTPNIKYAKGFFVTGDNRIATSNDLDKLNNRYLYWWFNTPLKHL